MTATTRTQRSPSWWRVALGIVLLWTAAASTVAAQEDDAGSLDAAETAFAELEYERARDLARSTLEAGGNGLTETARLYELIGTSAVLLGDEDAAFEAYRRQLAIRPDSEMDRSLSPALRTPFLRARGWWAGQSSPFNVQLSLGDPGRDRPLRFMLRLDDPLGVGAELVLAVRADRGDTYREHRLPAEASAVVGGDELALEAGASDFEYFVTVLDANGNTVHSLGTSRSPESVANPRVDQRTVGGSGPSGAEGGGGSVLEEWWFWTIIGVVVAGGVAAGVYFAIPEQLNGRLTVSFGT